MRFLNARCASKTHRSLAFVQLHYYESDPLFARYFFVANDMRPPNGQTDFVRLTTERLVALAETTRKHKWEHVIHLENDNMLYISAEELVSVAHDSCHWDVAYPVIREGQAALSICYFRNAVALERMAKYIISVYESGKDKAIETLHTGNVNDMSLAYHYLHRTTRVDELPSHPHLTNNCVWNAQTPRVLYDAAAIGQFFGGLHWNPKIRHFEPQRPYRELQHRQLTWRPCSGRPSLRCPWIENYQIANLHIHSKDLIRFAS